MAQLRSGLPCQYINGVAAQWFAVPVRQRRSCVVVCRASTTTAQCVAEGGGETK